MNTSTTQLERALQICEMIESANNFISALQKDLNAYNSGDLKIRMMLTKSWIEKNLRKYTGIKERLTTSFKAIMDCISTQDAVKVPAVNSLYCFAPAAQAGLNEPGIVRFIGSTKSGKLYKFEFVNYIDKKRTKFNLLCTNHFTNFQKIA